MLANESRMPNQPLRIVSYNVRYFGHALRGLASTRASKRGIATQLASLEPWPDIICLQEVETRSIRSSIAHRKNGSRKTEETQLESFMAEFEEAFAQRGAVCPYEAFYFRAHSYRLAEVPIYTTGLAILVNLRTVRVDAHNVTAPEHITYHHVASWKDRKQSRICAHVQLVSASGQRFHVFNTHLSLPTPFHRQFWSQRDKMGFGVNQLHEARSLCGFIHRHAGEDPFVVCGDFNSPPGSPDYRYLTQEGRLIGAQETLRQIDPSALRGFPTAGFMRLRMHLDHLFAGGPVSWVDLEGTAPYGDPRNPFHGLSDHVPLLGRFQLGS
jgi:endonuclease/exonuclease/phosphatase family metal-dependent hydrolase